LSDLTGSNSAGADGVEATVVASSTAGNRSPLTIGVDLNLVSRDTSRAGSRVPGDSSGRIASTSNLSSTDGGSSGSNGGGVSHRIGPLSDVASRSTDSEADR